MGPPNNRVGSASLPSCSEAHEECKYTRTFPLLQENELFFYYGAATGWEDKCGASFWGDNDEQVDHVEELIHPPRNSLRMEATRKEMREHQQQCSSIDVRPRVFVSEVACNTEWTMQSNVSHEAGERSDNICIKEFISLKLRVADLESQLQKLECENIGLKQKLKQAEQAILNRCLGAQRTQASMQKKSSSLEKEMEELRYKNEALQVENRLLGHRRRFNGYSLSNCPKRRDIEGEMEPHFPEETDTDRAYLPFPKQPRRLSMFEKHRRRMPAVIPISSSQESRPMIKWPPLIEFLQGSFKEKVRGKPSSERMNGSWTTMTTEASTIASQAHESWATADEINAQTKLFNRQASARASAKTKQDALGKEGGHRSAVGSLPEGNAVSLAPGRP